MTRQQVTKIKGRRLPQQSLRLRIPGREVSGVQRRLELGYVCGETRGIQADRVSVDQQQGRLLGSPLRLQRGPQRRERHTEALAARLQFSSRPEHLDQHIAHGVQVSGRIDHAAVADD